MSTKSGSSSENPSPEIQYPAGKGKHPLRSHPTLPVTKDGDYLELSHSQLWEIVEGDPEGDDIVPSSQPDQDYSHPPQFLSRYLNSSTTHVYTPSRQAHADSEESIVPESENTDDEEHLSPVATETSRNTSGLSEPNAPRSSQHMQSFMAGRGTEKNRKRPTSENGLATGSSSQCDDGPTTQRPVREASGHCSTFKRSDSVESVEV